MSMASPTSTLIPRPHVKYRVTEAGGMLVDLQTGACFELNRVGADVWERMVAGASLGDTVAAIREKYSIPADIVDVDVNRVYLEIIAAGLGDRGRGWVGP